MSTSAPKNIAKSIRLTQETYDYILSFPGDGFNKKIESLIDFTIKNEVMLKEKNEQASKELARITKKITEKQKVLSALNQRIHNIENGIQNIEENIIQLNSETQKIRMCQY